MALKTRMAVAIALLFGLLFAFFMVIVFIAAYFGVVGGELLFFLPLVVTFAVILLQWWLSPYVIGWLYHVHWVEPDEFGRDIADFIRSECEANGIKPPKLGIVPDNNPNAFCFGWTRNSSRLVLTEGIRKYCNKDEQKAVVGHEMGHIVHNDFVVMTIVTSIPMIMYSLYLGSRLVIFSRGRKKGNVVLMALAVWAISYLVYILSQFIALLVSRYREYWADDYSGHVTRNPNALSSALVKIAYGLSVEGLGERSDKEHRRYENALMIFNPTMARALASVSADRQGNFSKEKIKETMAWDLWNPWAMFLELQMTHPLPAKRIKALGVIAEDHGMKPYIKFDLKQPESYWDDFARDVFAKYSALLAIPVAYLYFTSTGRILQTAFLAIFTASLCLLLYWNFYRYPHWYRDKTVEELVTNPKASPIKGIPARLRGRIIGRGIPGLLYSEDLKLDDGTGLLLLDYHQVLRIIDFFVGLLKTEEKIGKDVIVEGWYRRAVVPYLEIYKMEIDGKVKKTYTADLSIGVSLLFVLISAMLFFVTAGVF